jgi:hypothetical protein
VGGRRTRGCRHRENGNDVIGNAQNHRRGEACLAQRILGMHDDPPHAMISTMQSAKADFVPL